MERLIFFNPSFTKPLEMRLKLYEGERDSGRHDWLWVQSGAVWVGAKSLNYNLASYNHGFGF